jgi:hypothetical protein
MSGLLHWLSEEFRNNAPECLELSRKSNSLESQGYWVAMAQFWFDLAVHAEDRSAIESVDPSVVDTKSKKIAPLSRCSGAHRE